MWLSLLLPQSWYALFFAKRDPDSHIAWLYKYNTRDS